MAMSNKPDETVGYLRKSTRSPSATSELSVAAGSAQGSFSAQAERHSKVAGISLALGLQRGFVEVVEALDSVTQILAGVTKAGQDGAQPTVMLRDKTKSLLQTKGTQAIYWLQLMKEIKEYCGGELAELASACRQRLNILAASAEKDTSADALDTSATEKLGPPNVVVRVLFDSHRKKQLSLDGLQRAMEELIMDRDANWDDKVTRLHVHYGRLIDDLKFDFYTELERAAMEGREGRQTSGEEKALTLAGGDGRIDIEELFERLGKIGEEDEAEKGITTTAGPGLLKEQPTREKFLGTISSLKIIIPPKLATIQMPRFPADRAPQGLQQTLISGSAPTSGMAGCMQLCSGQSAHSLMNPFTTSGPHQTQDGLYKFHLTFPQQEVKVPAHVIERYARDVLYKNYEIVAPDDPRMKQVDGPGVKGIQISVSAEPEEAEVPKDPEEVSMELTRAESPNKVADGSESEEEAASPSPEVVKKPSKTSRGRQAPRSSPTRAKVSGSAAGKTSTSRTIPGGSGKKRTVIATGVGTTGRSGGSRVTASKRPSSLAPPSGKTRTLGTRR